jgi:hypothetical protein
MSERLWLVLIVIGGCGATGLAVAISSGTRSLLDDLAALQRELAALTQRMPATNQCLLSSGKR